MSKHAVNTEALQAVINYHQEVIQKHTKLLQDLLQDAVGVTLNPPPVAPIEPGPGSQFEQMDKPIRKKK